MLNDHVYRVQANVKHIDYVQNKCACYVRCVLHVFACFAGPPLAPYPNLAILNSTALLLSWKKPFTWPQVADILNYTVTMYNRSGKMMEWIVEPSSHNESNMLLISSNGSVAETCMEVTFEVSARNSIGLGRNLSVSGGFPIGKLL